MVLVWGTDPYVSRFGRQVDIVDMGLVRPHKPLQLWKQLIRNERPELCSQRWSDWATIQSPTDPSLFHDVRRAGIVARMKKPAVEGVEHAIVGAGIAHLSSFPVPAIKLSIVLIDINEVVPITRVAYRDRQ